MNIFIISQYYYPEEIGPAVWLKQLVDDLIEKGNAVNILTAFPNYPERIVHKKYKRKIFLKERIGKAWAFRAWIYANPSNSHFSRIMNWGSFCLTSFIVGLLAVRESDFLYVIMPPLPLGFLFVLLAKIKKVKIICCVEDLYPLIAVELGIIKNKHIIRIFNWMESWAYKNANGIIGISDEFKEHFILKGANKSKIFVIPNWVDDKQYSENKCLPGIRERLGLQGRFIVLYSGGISYNSCLEVLLDAVKKMNMLPISVLIIGDGIHKKHLQNKVFKEKIENVIFLPFQSMSEYMQCLKDADVTVVTLNKKATLASVPSKIFKQMAAGRPILAIVDVGNQIEKMVKRHRMGICVPTENPDAIGNSIKYLINNKTIAEEMGENGKKAIKECYNRNICTHSIELVMKKVFIENKEVE